MSLPKADADALDHSLRLTGLLRAEIATAGGWIDFARYMELALYAPGLGYYSAGASKLGPTGDFVTAPEISPLFAATLATQVADGLAAAGDTIVELGAGTGRLAAGLLRELAALGRAPARYAILEVSPDLRQRQRQLIADEAPEWLDRVVWLDRPPARFSGVLVANEVLDAVPVHLLHWTGAGLLERGVGLAGDGFDWSDRAIADPGLERVAAALPKQAPGYVSEICPAAPALITTLAEPLERGLMLFIDYGFPRAEYYHAHRDGGTLMCHYRHRAHADPFFLPGLQDITAHVDFSAIAEAAVEAGLTVLGYSDQASFLINCGLLERLVAGGTDGIDYARAVGAAQKLIQPTEMGELFKVIALARGVDGPLRGFTRGDRRHAL
jgi:SAM-dependent MidA family methyltransferase